jgi:hypothetical protein
MRMFRMFRRPWSGRLAIVLAIAVVAIGISIPQLAIGQRPSAGAAAKKKKSHSDAKQDLALINKQAKKLRGPRGATGPTGPTGPAGSLAATLQSGQSLKGAYGVIDHAGAALERVGTAISFEIPLASAPTAHFIAKGTTPPAACPGTATNPKASPGNLCIYEAQNTNISTQSFEDPITGATGSTVQPFGAEVVGLSAAAGDIDESGSWAVTAP